MTPNPELANWQLRVGWTVRTPFDCLDANLRATVFETCQLASSPAEAREEATIAAAFRNLPIGKFTAARRETGFCR
jgi:hypothetical protein